MKLETSQTLAPDTGSSSWLRAISDLPRYRLVTLTTWCSQAIVGIVQILAIRVIIAGLGIESYAVWGLLVGLQGFFSLADFGLGAALQNWVTEALARAQPLEPLIRRMLTMALGLWLGIALLLHLAAPWLAGAYLHQFGSLSLTTKTATFELVGDSLSLLAIGQIGYKVWFGQHQGYWANACTALGYLLGLLAMWIYVRHATVPELPWIAVTYLSPRAVVALAAWWAHFGRARIASAAWVANRATSTTAESVRQVWRRALRFWLLAVEAMAILQVDYLILSQYGKSIEIAEYSVAMRVFLILTQLYIAVMNALWPHLGTLLAHGHHQEARAVLHRHLWEGLILGGLVALAAAALLPRAATLFDPRHDLHFSLTFTFLCAAYVLVQIWVLTYGTLCQSADCLRDLILAGPIQLILNVALELLWIRSYGIRGVVGGLIVSYLLTSAWINPARAYSILRGRRLPQPAGSA